MRTAARGYQSDDPVSAHLVGSLRSCSLAALAFSASAVVAAWGLEHLGGYVPCKLCLEQRQYHYVGLVMIALACIWTGIYERKRSILDLNFAAIHAGVACLVFAKGGWTAAYHAGVEWGWWQGPDNCGLDLAGDTATLLERIQQTPYAPCDQAALRILGISLSGWNAAVSAGVTLLSAGAIILLVSSHISWRKEWRARIRQRKYLPRRDAH